MKRKFLSFLGVAVMALGVISCGSDDNSSDKGNNKLIGKWTIMEELALDAKGNVVETDMYDNGACPLDVAEFLVGGFYQNTYYDYSEVASDCKSEVEEATWKVEGDKLKLGFVEGALNVEAVFTIKELSDNTLLVDRPMTRDEAEDYELNVVTIRQVFKKVK